MIGFGQGIEETDVVYSSFDEIEQFAKILGEDDPFVTKALCIAKLFPEKTPQIRKALLIKLQKSGYSLDNLPVFIPNIQRDSSNSIILGNAIVGTEAGTGVGLSLESFKTPVLIAGITGTGKTTLMVRLAEQLAGSGVKIIFFDTQNEYSKVLKVFPKNGLIAMSPEQDKDNLLEPPTGVSIQEWISKQVDFLRESWFLRDSSCNLLRKAYENLYRSLGWCDGQEGRRLPNVKDVIATLQVMQFKPGTRQGGYLETLLNRFNGLGPLLKTFDCEKGYAIEKLFERSVVFRLGNLSDDHRLMYTALKLARFSSYREKLGEFQKLEYLFVIEEAHKFCSPKLEKRIDLVEPSIFTLGRTIRKRGASIVLIEQVPSSLPYQLMGNIDTKIVLRLGDTRSIVKLAELMVLNERQAEYISVLPFRQGILQSPEYPEAVLFQIPEVKYEPVYEEEVREATEPILSSLDFVPSQNDEIRIEEMNLVENKEEKRSWILVKDPHKKLLQDILNYPFDGINERRKRLGDWSSWYAGKIIRELEQIGFIGKPISLSLGGRGNPRKMLQLGAKGAKFMGVDYDSLQLKGKGSDEHKFLQGIGVERLKGKGKNAFLEYCLNGKSADIVVLADDGKYHAYEIELDSTNPHIVENVKRDLEVFSSCTIIGRNHQAENEIKSKVYKEISFEDYPRIKFQLLKDLLT